MKRLALALTLLAAQPLLADSNLPPAYWSNRELPDTRQEAQAQALCLQQPDVREAYTAFTEKREPEFAKAVTRDE